LDLSREQLLELAAQLGSDVAFFLYGGTALAEGRGERVTPLSPLPRMQVILIVPSVPRMPGKTKELYARLESSHYTQGQITERVAETLREGKEFTSTFLFNTFENIVFTDLSEINVYRKHIMKTGADNVHLAGSGPTLFTLLKNKAEAEDLYVGLKQQKMETYLTETFVTVS
jgi:4-diphosphocytidyl-2-C-methyl-D-erythritol kinase